MTRVIRHEVCPKCAESGKDSRGDNLAIYSDGGFHCFSCGYHHSGRFTPPYLKEVDHHGSKGVLPSDFTREVPRKAWEWLLQYGLGYSYWKTHCGYSPSQDRLIFTVGEPTEFSLGRYVGSEAGHAKWYTWGDTHRAPHFYGNMEAAKKVVLVEDIVSAHKVAQTHLATPLLGTHLYPPLVPVLRHLGAPITMWLDQDQRDKAQQRARWLSVVTGLPVNYVFTDKDPKALSSKQITEILE